MSRSSYGALLLATCAILSACSNPQFSGTEDDASSPLASCEGGACEGAAHAESKLDAAVDGSSPTAPIGPSGGDGGPLAGNDAASSNIRDDDGRVRPSPDSQTREHDAQVASDARSDGGGPDGLPASQSGSFCSRAVDVDFCSDFESEGPEAGFDYSAVDPDGGAAKLLETAEPGHDRHLLELSLTGSAGAKYVHDFADDVRSIRVEFDIWVKTPPAPSDDPLEIVKIQQEVPPDDYPGLSLFVHATGSGVLIGNTVSQPDGGPTYVATTFELPPLESKWTRVRLDVWPGLSGRVRVYYDGVEQLDKSAVRIHSDNAVKTYASLGLYASRIGSTSVWYDNVIVDTDF